MFNYFLLIWHGCLYVLGRGQGFIKRKKWSDEINLREGGAEFKENVDTSTPQIGDIESQPSCSHSPLSLKEKIDVGEEVKESSVLGSLSEMKQVIKEELTSLSTEQLGCLTNLLGFIMVLGGMITITLILFGDYILNYHPRIH